MQKTKLYIIQFKSLLDPYAHWEDDIPFGKENKKLSTLRKMFQEQQKDNPSFHWRIIERVETVIT